MFTDESTDMNIYVNHYFVVDCKYRKLVALATLWLNRLAITLT